MYVIIQIVMERRFNIKEVLKELEEIGIKRQFLNTSEVAKLFGIHPATVKRWINNKAILGIKIYDSKKQKYRYFVPIWFLKNLLPEEMYKVYLLHLKNILESKKTHKYSAGQ